MTAPRSAAKRAPPPPKYFRVRALPGALAMLYMVTLPPLGRWRRHFQAADGRVYTETSE